MTKFIKSLATPSMFRAQVAFMPYRVNGQYIMEGLASSFLFTVGGLGFVVLDRVQAQPLTPRLNKVTTNGLCFFYSLNGERGDLQMKEQF